MKLDDLRDLDRDDLLSILGITASSPGQTIFSGLGIFAAGLLLGAGGALLLAPKSGQGLREDLREKLQQLRDQAGTLKDNEASDSDQAPVNAAEARP